MTVDELASRVAERIDAEFRGFWTREDLLEAIPALIREEGELVRASTADAPLSNPDQGGERD